MNKYISTITLMLALVLSATISKAQLTALDFNRNDCNGTNHHLFADLDAGKAVILHFYMPSCGSCPPPAQKIQAMANNILSSYPGMITAYAFPFEDITTCSYSASWVTSNNLNLYSPMDSGATAVAYYGGFGMPTVVLLGGTDHRVMFSTQSFSTSDTTTMRDSILSLFGASPSALNEVSDKLNSVELFPNPSVDIVSIKVEVKETANVKIKILDMTGKLISNISDEKNVKGSLIKQFNTSSLADGIYLVQINVDGKNVNRKLVVSHQ